MKNRLLVIAIISMIGGCSQGQADDIVHDAEYYILAAQNGEKWAAEDKNLDEELAAFRAKNGGKPPNIFYILIDDIGFGDLGSETLNAVRGYKTPAINEFSYGFRPTLCSRPSLGRSFLAPANRYPGSMSRRPVSRWRCRGKAVGSRSAASTAPRPSPMPKADSNCTTCLVNVIRN